MNDMNVFIQTLRTESTANNAKRRERDFENRKLKDEQITSSMNELEQMISENMEQKMKESASLGHFQTVLYSFDTSTMFNDFKSIFLIRGPLVRKNAKRIVNNNNNEAFFMNKGIKPMLVRFREKLSPMHVYVRYNRIEKCHELLASWRDYEDNMNVVREN